MKAGRLARLLSLLLLTSYFLPLTSYLLLLTSYFLPLTSFKKFTIFCKFSSLYMPMP